MNPAQLTDKQLSHREQFDKRTTAVITVDFMYYRNAKRFGPWNPYWYVYNQLDRFSEKKGKKLLVIGCGNGKDSVLYAHMGYQVYGIDISPVAIGMARSLSERNHYEQRTIFSVQPSETLEFPDNYFDMVVGVNVLHHVDIQPTMKEIARVIKQGGLAIFKEPMDTPRRRKIRESPMITWLVPKATKNIFSKVKYDLIEGEKNLDDSDLSAMSDYFNTVEVHKWRVLAVLDVIFSRSLLEKLDWVLFKIFPHLRSFGDQAVLILSNPKKAMI